MKSGKSWCYTGNSFELVEEFYSQLSNAFFCCSYCSYCSIAIKKKKEKNKKQEYFQLVLLYYNRSTISGYFSQNIFSIPNS